MIRFFKPYYLVISICLVFFILHKNKKWGNETQPWNNICSDGRGYYAWLPAIFIYNDLNFGFYYTVDKDETNMPNKGCFQNYLSNQNGRNTNKYYLGTAICESPFFLVAHVYCKISGKYKANGYTFPYFISIGIAALVWLYLGIFFLWKSMSLLNISNWCNAITCLIVLLGTNTLFYSVDAPGYSHIFSFALLSIFIWCSLKFRTDFEVKYLYLITVFGGLIFITRPVNISIIILLPFLLQKRGFLAMYQILFKPAQLLITLILALFFPLILISIYKFSTGSFFVYSYGKETFDFLHPHIIEFLTDYDNGLFKYLPAMAIPFLFLPFTKFNNHKALAWGLVSTVIVTIYIHASWWCWSYGGSFGSRTLLDFMSVFALLIALILQFSNTKLLVIQLVFYFLCIAFTMILYHQKTHGYMFESPITGVEYWKSICEIIK